MRQITLWIWKFGEEKDFFLSQGLDTSNKTKLIRKFLLLLINFDSTSPKSLKYQILSLNLPQINFLGLLLISCTLSNLITVFCAFLPLKEILSDEITPKWKNYFLHASLINYIPWRKFLFHSTAKRDFLAYARYTKIWLFILRHGDIIRNEFHATEQ